MKIRICAFCLFFLGFSGTAAVFGDEENKTGEAAVDPQYLFVHNASGLSYADGKLTMTGVAPQTIFFSDRPNRITGHTPTDQFVKEWGIGEDNFAENNPNAVLAVFDGAGLPADSVVVLSNPEFSKGNLTYDVDVLDGTIPESGGECSLFIDIIGRPMTPVSVAGVARRTTRRRVIWGTAATAAAASSYHYAAPQPTTVVVQTPPQPSNTTTVVTAPAPAQSDSGGAKTPEERLAELKNLLDKGLITQSEYDAKRQAILSEL